MNPITSVMGFFSLQVTISAKYPKKRYTKSVEMQVSSEGSAKDVKSK